MAQSRTGFGELVVRTSGDPLDALAAIRTATSAVLPDVPLRDVRTMAGIVGQRMAQRRLNMLLLGLFGLLGLVIAAVGIYGIMAYVVAQRTREIGVRMALGATRRDIIRMVLASAARMVGVGLVAGAIGAWWLSASADTFLFGLEGDDPRAILLASLLLSAVALTASLVPARRAASVDPLDALRAE
jgi:ABC-type antimicrobial peptide transport system permease subunit